MNFPLLADTEFEVIEAYGARRMKSFFGKSFLGIVRTTFWIGRDGTIRKIWNPRDAHRPFRRGAGGDSGGQRRELERTATNAS